MSRGDPTIEAAVILSGGLSQRMGSEKALLGVGGTTLIERLALRLFSHCDRLIISVAARGPSEGLREALRRCEATTEKPIEVVCDFVEGQGPLAGVSTVLDSLRSRQAFFVAVDMPNVSLELARALWLLALEPDALGAVPCWSRGLEPAFAVYSKALLPAARGLLQSGTRSLQALASISGVRTLDLSELGALSSYAGPLPGNPEELFRSLNTPQELENWQRTWPSGPLK